MKAAMQAAHDDKFESIARQMGRWTDHVLGPDFRKYRPDEAWSPAVNLCEDEDCYTVIVELSGVQANQINLQIRGRTLMLSGFREVPLASEPCETTQVCHMEIDHGPFSRSVPLPKEVDPDKIEARYRNGYLWIRVPKRV